MYIIIDYFDYINRVLNFHQNELSCGIEYPIFKVGNDKEMVFRRLERATKDEADGQLLHSRYEIWASSVAELIDSAIQNIKRSNSADALEEMEHVLRAVNAYRDIQAIFDKENINKRSKIFEAYSIHLLDRDDRNSELIEKEEIIRRLKKYSKVPGVGIPRDIDFSIKNGVLKVFIKNPTHNMQNNSAAFEGWILVLKAWMPSEIKYVELDFTVPTGFNEPYGRSEVCHYNRFIYRLNNMLCLFPDWFFVNKDKINIVFNFMSWLKSSSCILNHSLQERESVITTENLERQIESWFVFGDGKGPLCNNWGIDQTNIYNQLPIGVFYKKIAKANAIFTRGSSAIDLWGIGEDKKTLHLIELKCGNNKGIGVISEILFYALVVYDACIADEGLFTFGKYGKYSNTKDMIALHNNGVKFDQLFVHILAEKYHPLFNTTVLGLIETGLGKLGIKFDRATYDYTKKVIINVGNNISGN